jgi:hypothetical protein
VATDIATQASDDAINIIQANDPKWMVKVYMASPALSIVQSYIDSQDWPVAADQLAGSIYAAMNSLQPSDLRHISWHLSGDAFDVQPTDDQTMVAALQALVDARNASGGTAKLLTKEGGLTRWHIQAI